MLLLRDLSELLEISGGEISKRNLKGLDHDLELKYFDKMNSCMSKQESLNVSELLR
jgi:hypothetical protein